MKHHPRFRLLAVAAVVLVLSSCASSSSGGSGSDDGMKGMDHSSTGSKEPVPQMIKENGRYSDKAFIDAMVPHHEGAVEMARVALKHAEHKEVKRLAEDIVSAQRAEIESFGEIREKRFGAAEGHAQMSEQDMAGMGMAENPRRLADADPFDKAFIDAMIPHHEAAIEMAEAARQRTKDPEIREIAGNIVSSQKHEISQMQRWREEWYPHG